MILIRNTYRHDSEIILPNSVQKFHKIIKCCNRSICIFVIMKKWFSICFTVLYFGFSSGIVYTVRQCVTQNWSSKNNCKSEKCGHCDSTKKENNCCKNDATIAKTDLSKTTDVFAIPSYSITTKNNFILPNFEISSLRFARALSIQTKEPPNSPKQPIFIINNNLRI